MGGLYGGRVYRGELRRETYEGKLWRKIMRGYMEKDIWSGYKRGDEVKYGEGYIRGLYEGDI
jgi:hypothetical protein